MKRSQCAANINWKIPQLPSVLSYAGTDEVKTITSIGESNLDLRYLPSVQGGIGIAQQSAQGDVGIVHRVCKVSWVT